MGRLLACYAANRDSYLQLCYFPGHKEGVTCRTNVTPQSFIILTGQAMCQVK